MRPPNGTVIVHRKHFLGLRAGESFRVGTFTIYGCARVGPYYALRLPVNGSLLRAQYHELLSILRLRLHSGDIDQGGRPARSQT